VSVLEVHPNDVDTANPTHGGMFSYSLAVGNLDNTSRPDLVVGAPRADRVVVTPVIFEAGAIDIFRDPQKLSKQRRSQHVHQRVPERENHDGWSVAIANFSNPSGSVYGDIAVGVPDRDGPPGYPDVGLVVVYYGHDAGGVPTWNDDAGFYEGEEGGLPQTDARTGTSVAAGDYTADGWSDLALGSPGSATGPEGFVTIFNGTPTSGIVYAGSRQDEFTIIANVDALGNTSTNRFGFALVWANTSGQLDLIIGSPGMKTSLTMAGGRFIVAHPSVGVVPRNWPQDSYSESTPNNNEEFGYCVTAAIRGGTVRTDILVGAPHANIPGVTDAGEAFAFIF
jgi:hypothetical protein